MITPFAGGNMERTRTLLQAYRDAWRAAGHHGEGQLQTAIHCYVAETHKEAIDGFRRRVSRYVEVFSEAVTSWSGHQATQYAGYGKMVEAIRNLTGDKMIENHTALVGTPDEVVSSSSFTGTCSASTSRLCRSTSAG